MDLVCPCGEIHELSAETRVAYENVTRGLPPTVLIAVNGHAWQVPRIYLAVHGLAADDLPALAERYGWVSAAEANPRETGKTERIERSIRELIQAGDLEPGGRLPSERDLAQKLAAGRTTIRLVLTKLAAEGVIRSEHGRGYFVIPPPTAAP